MKKIALIIIAVAVAGGGSFYGGMKYAQGKGLRGFGNMTAEERQQRFGQIGDIAPNGQRGQGMGGVSGEIIAKDANSITVKLRDSGSKIVLFSDATEISKFVSGTSGDLAVGKTVMVTGKTNDDGSVTAQSIQLRPVIPTPSATPAK